MAERGWMYSGWTHSKSTDEWYNKTKEFIDFAFSMPSVVQNGNIKCPCAKCRNYERKNRDDVELDLCHFGFKRNYTVWTAHGEGHVEITNYVDAAEADRMDTMLNDLAARAPPIEQQPIAAATNMNTYKCMKAGVTNCTETGESGPMNNVKAQERVDDYIKAVKVAHPENWEEHDLDPEIVYSSGGGMPHGRLAMCNGAIKKAVVFAKAKEKDIRPSNSMSYQDLLRRNVQLEKRCKNDFILSKHVQNVYDKMGWEIPEDLLAFHDELVDDSTGDPMNSISEAQEDGGASLTDHVRAEDHAHATHLNEHGTPAHLGMPLE